jgi:hypothetical protein
MRVRTTRGSGQIGYRMTRRRHDFGFPHHPAPTPWRTLAVCVLAALACVACIVFPPAARAAGAPDVGASGPASAPRYALVLQESTPLRSGPKSGGTPLAVLAPGELLELRGERMDYAQVWVDSLERGGFVRTNALRPLTLQPAEAPELLTLVRFLRTRPGSEALGLGLAAAYLKAAPAGTIGAEVLDAMGTMAERLAWRANAAADGAEPARPGAASVAAQLQVAASLGVRFDSVERDGHVTLCYDGDAFRHVFALQPTPEQAARAALALTRHDCVPDTLPPLQRWQADQARAALLARVPAAALAPYVRDRLRMREAGVWAAIAFEDSRRLAVETGKPASAGLPPVREEDVLNAGNQALAALAGVDRAELADDDQSTYADAAMRVGASRWAAEPVVAAPSTGLRVATQPGQPGETCVLLLDAKHAAANALIRHCTFGTVWPASARSNPRGTALSLAVQPLAAWREMWMFRSTAEGWTLQVLPPALSVSDVGYVEFAGWVPATGEVLAAREVQDAAHGNRAVRTYELLNGETLATERAADAPGSLSAFYRWQDAGWRRVTVSLR